MIGCSKLYSKNATLSERSQYFETSLNEINLSRDYFPENLTIPSVGMTERFSILYSDDGRVTGAWYKKVDSPFMVLVHND